MQINSIDHAVPLKMEYRCPICHIFFSDLFLRKDEIYITNCGHVYDRKCLKLLDKRVCRCRKTIEKVELLCHNYWGVCGHHSEIHQDLPASIAESLSQSLQMLITNCGHLLHGACWLEIVGEQYEQHKMGFCPTCSQKITHLEFFSVKPISYDEWKAENEKMNHIRSDLVIQDFEESESAKALPKAPSLLNLDSFEFLS